MLTKFTGFTGLERSLGCIHRRLYFTKMCRTKMQLDYCCSYQKLFFFPTLVQLNIIFSGQYCQYLKPLMVRSEIICGALFCMLQLKILWFWNLLFYYPTTISIFILFFFNRWWWRWWLRFSCWNGNHFLFEHIFPSFYWREQEEGGFHSVLGKSRQLAWLRSLGKINNRPGSLVIPTQDFVICM